MFVPHAGGKMIDGACGRDRCAVEALRLNETRQTEFSRCGGFAGARLREFGAAVVAGLL